MDLIPRMGQCKGRNQSSYLGPCLCLSEAGIASPAVMSLYIVVSYCVFTP